MRFVVCPHCKAHRIVTAKMPKDVVIVIPCPACHQLIVMFRNKAVALSRETLEHGTHDQRKFHFAELIDQFIKPGMFSFGTTQEGNQKPDLDSRAKGSHDRPELTGEPATESPISRQEIEHFVQVDLKAIDDPAYFRKHFG